MQKTNIFCVNYLEIFHVKQREGKQTNYFGELLIYFEEISLNKKFIDNVSP